ncbi:hypothetical protein C5167_031121 [Papaver somniferum]|nr:hypothetical protein C5167_031121 [Papaver somniferum]
MASTADVYFTGNFGWWRTLRKESTFIMDDVDGCLEYYVDLAGAANSKHKIPFNVPNPTQGHSRFMFSRNLG